MKHFATRPADFTAAKALSSEATILVQLHAIMDRRALGNPFALQPTTMAYAGELIEELRSFRANGQRAFEAATPALIEHAIATRHLDMLLCLHAATAATEMRQRIESQAEEMMQQAPLANSSQSERQMEMTAIRHAFTRPVCVVSVEHSVDFQRMLARSQLRSLKKDAADITNIAPIAMRAHRLMRYAEMTDTAPAYENVAARKWLHRKGMPSWVMALIGFTHTPPGMTNPAIREIHAWDIAREQALQGENQAPILVRPSHYLPVDNGQMTVPQMARGVAMLASKQPMDTMDLLRIGQLLEALQTEQGQAGQEVISRQREAWVRQAMKARNIPFLCALGQVTTKKGEPLRTLGLLYKLTGDATRAIDPVQLQGHWSPTLDRSESEAEIQRLIAIGNKGDLPLMGMALQRQRFISGFVRELDEPTKTMEDWLEEAKTAQNIVAMQAISYMRTEPGQPLADRNQILEVERALQPEPPSASDISAVLISSVRRLHADTLPGKGEFDGMISWQDYLRQTNALPQNKGGADFRLN